MTETLYPQGCQRAANIYAYKMEQLPPKERDEIWDLPPDRLAPARRMEGVLPHKLAVTEPGYAGIRLRGLISGRIGDTAAHQRALSSTF